MSRIITHTPEGVEIDQGDDNWKQLRVGLFTGTGICDLLPGARGYTKAREDQIDEVVTEVITGKPSGGFTATKYMKEGIEREPFARMFYQERTGDIITQVAFIQHDWMRAGMSPDGVIQGRKRNVEIKCPKDRTHLRYLRLETCPEEYLPQVATQQWLGDFEDTDFISYHPDFPEELQLHIIRVPRQVEMIKQIEAEVSKAQAEVNLRVKAIRAIAEARKVVLQ